MVDMVKVRSLCLEALRDDGGGVEGPEEEDFFLEEGEEEEKLDDLIRRNSHFPTSEMSDLLKVRCRALLERGKHSAAAVALLHSQGLLFRHQVLVQYNKRLRRREEKRRSRHRKEKEEASSDKDLFPSDEEDDEEKAERLIKKAMAFQDLSSGGERVAERKLRQIVSVLPQEWRVVQVTCKPTLAYRFRPPGSQDRDGSGAGWRDRNPGLYVTVVHCGAEFRTGVFEVPPLPNGDRPTIMREYADVVAEHRLLHQKTKENFKQAAYDRARDELDDRMRGLLRSLEERCLGYARTLLLGRPRDPRRAEQVAEEVERILRRARAFKGTSEYDRNFCLLSALLHGASLLTREEVAEGCRQLCGKDGKAFSTTVLKEVQSAVVAFGANNPAPGDGRGNGPVTLILDSEIQALPLESMSVLAKQPCSRVPSIFFLSALYETHEKNKSSVAKVGVRNDRIFYILNPNQDLKKTQDRLEEPFRSLSLGEGVVGQWPSLPKIQGALSTMDAFVYCGHGSRLRTMSAQEIEKLRIRALPLLFGCNSGRLEQIGSAFDPIGGAHAYLIATAPCLLGFLWSITDMDLDRWTVRFLGHWLSKAVDTGGEKDFVRAVSEMRGDFKRLLNGAALVIYGLPAFLEENAT